MMQTHVGSRNTESVPFLVHQRKKTYYITQSSTVQNIKEAVRTTSVWCLAFAESWIAVSHTFVIFCVQGYRLSRSGECHALNTRCRFTSCHLLSISLLPLLLNPAAMQAVADEETFTMIGIAHVFQQCAQLNSE
jgi:hypothetical protein